MLQIHEYFIGKVNLTYFFLLLRKIDELFTDHQKLFFRLRNTTGMFTNTYYRLSHMKKDHSNSAHKHNCRTDNNQNDKSRQLRISNIVVKNDRNKSNQPIYEKVHATKYRERTGVLHVHVLLDVQVKELKSNSLLPPKNKVKNVTISVAIR